MSQSSTLFIGMDVHNESITVAYVPQDHGAEVTYLGPMGTRQADIDKLIRNMQSKAKHLIFVYEAGPCGSRREAGTCSGWWVVWSSPADNCAKVEESSRSETTTNPSRW
jgi:hypothetical protein